MEFVEIMRIKARMCKTSKSCQECPISAYNNGHSMACESFVKSAPEKAEKAIIEWAKEHPAMTNGQKFSEVFGIDVELHTCDYFDCPGGDCEKCPCDGFWDKEYVEPRRDNR